QGQPHDAIAVCRRNRDPVAHVLITFLRAMELPMREREQLVSASGSREIRRMERGTRAIAVIARLSPLMGLLGTVVGLVTAFRTVATVQGSPDASLLAGGIWQALLTTVAGLIVAIPAIMSHEWLEGRI